MNENILNNNDNQNYLSKYNEENKNKILTHIDILEKDLYYLRNILNTNNKKEGNNYVQINNYNNYKKDDPNNINNEINKKFIKRRKMIKRTLFLLFVFLIVGITLFIIGSTLKIFESNSFLHYVFISHSITLIDKIKRFFIFPFYVIKAFSNYGFIPQGIFLCLIMVGYCLIVISIIILIIFLIIFIIKKIINRKKNKIAKIN